jgi:hypothetical protein
MKEKEDWYSTLLKVFEQLDGSMDDEVKQR